MAPWCFEGPYSADQLCNEPGVYIVIGGSSYNPNHIIDVGESGEVATRVRGHDRRWCWELYAAPCEYAFVVMYTGRRDAEQRRRIERSIRKRTSPRCGDLLMARPPAPIKTWHDWAVRMLADWLLADGHLVLADAPGHPRPGTIRASGGAGIWRPDIVATKDGITAIIEVESRDSHGRDRDQQRAFRNHARRRKNTIFHLMRI